MEYSKILVLFGSSRSTILSKSRVVHAPAVLSCSKILLRYGANIQGTTPYPLKPQCSTGVSTCWRLPYGMVLEHVEVGFQSRVATIPHTCAF
jgi:hypothetical protein